MFSCHCDVIIIITVWVYIHTISSKITCHSNFHWLWKFVLLDYWQMVFNFCICDATGIQYRICMKVSVFHKKRTVSFLIATTVLQCVFLFDDLGSDVCVSLSAGLNPEEYIPRQGQHLQRTACEAGQLSSITE